MKTLDLRQIVSDFSSNSAGFTLYSVLQKEMESNSDVILVVDKDMTLSSSFLNSSIGAILEEYGINKFKQNIKFQGSKSQFHRMRDYINVYNTTYLA